MANLITFPAAVTNVFPIANSATGGQLLTEYNLRARESVSTDPSVKYVIGPSFVHSEDDYLVRLESDGLGNPISSTRLEIAPGRGVFNGHFVENTQPMIIDIIEAQQITQAADPNATPLRGALSLGFQVLYSTEQTTSGSMLVEVTDPESEDVGMFLGIQTVLLPANEFITPADSPNDPSLVTAHIKLADFQFLNGAVSGNIVNNPNKCSYIDGTRIDSVQDLISTTFVTKTGLNAKKIYTFAGKGTDPLTGLDTWCDSTDSLMVWDKNPVLKLTSDTLYPGVDEATFRSDARGVTQLILPHKQVDYDIANTGGQSQFYAHKVYDLPKANYNNNSPGTVDSEYTHHIKEISNRLSQIYNIPNGRQRGFIDTLRNRAQGVEPDQLPIVNQQWSPGDYVVVHKDSTTGDGALPSTLYIVLPGFVASILYVTTTVDTEVLPVEAGLSGTLLSTAVTEGEPSGGDLSSIFDLTAGNWRGIPNMDFFLISWTETVIEDEVSESHVHRAYYTVGTASNMVYAEPVFLRGEFPLAQQDSIGGFLNVTESDLDYGYVFRDDRGNLRLLDYGLLRSGVLAYQLGEDWASPANLTSSELQSYLNNFVNERVAFPNYTQIVNSDNPNVIVIQLNLAAQTEEANLHIHSIDSRFGTSVLLQILGNANSNTIINISDCEKIRVDPNISGSPRIRLFRSNLYYDSQIIDYMRDSVDAAGGFLPGITDLSLWYEKFTATDPDLIVDSMTVRSASDPVALQDMDPWNEEAPNDNHFIFGLRGISFGTDGNITDCELLVGNNMTNNVESPGDYVFVSRFEIPQGGELIYPMSRLTHQLKVSGNFVSAYPADNALAVANTSFTALSQSYDPFSSETLLNGTISFHVRVITGVPVSGIDQGVSIDGWEPGSLHLFSGGRVG